jgi:hypothetical protein
LFNRKHFCHTLGLMLCLKQYLTGWPPHIRALVRESLGRIALVTWTFHFLTLGHVFSGMLCIYIINTSQSVTFLDSNN